jgi:hypothetical protein
MTGVLPAGPREPEVLLEQLGAAVLAEWHTLPMGLRKALYERAVAASADQLDAAKRELAVLLHEHMQRPDAE